MLGMVQRFVLTQLPNTCDAQIILKFYSILELVSRHRAASGDAGGPVLETKKSAEWAENPSIRTAMLESWSDSDLDETLKVSVLLILFDCAS